MQNRLISEKSPYLLQHAHNPVDWYAWGPEAFEKARREDKPIFLSVGYSTCHWCHVMERESFESEEIASLLNRHFVSIKVDREERPDVDRIYMTFVQATTGGGGWPMSVFLTGALQPFYGGTYFPPDDRYGRPGFKSLLEHVARAWQADRAKIGASAAGIVAQLEGHSGGGGPRSVLDAGLLDSAYQYFRRTFDTTHGGFGEAPKFPRPVSLNFLLRYAHRTGNPEALEMSLKTLRGMAGGGMNDQLGGGFHRYSVDERWFVPHFEKMLYDQAQLAVSYVEAYQIGGDAFYAEAARSVFEYVLRDLTAEAGAFFSAEDADSAADPARPREKSEGAFYVWSWKEIQAAAEGPAAELFAYRYGVESDGNVRHDPGGEFAGKNILYVRRSIAEAAAAYNLTEDQARASLARTSAALFERRQRRPRPHLDDKILTAWNGLMISAFAKGAQALDEPRYAVAARRAADFILTRLYDPASKTLLRRFRDGEAAVPGFLDDYAFFIAALLDLYETDFDPRRLDAAAALAARMMELFEDREQGAFFTTAEGDSSLLLRMKDDYDGAEPSGNSIAVLDLLRLAHLANRPDCQAAADRALAALSRRIAGQPPAVPQMLVAVERSLSGGRQIVVVGDPNSAETRAFLREIRSRFLPHHAVISIPSEEVRQALARFIPEAAGMQPIDGRATAYVCRDFACELPVNDPARLGELLK